MDVKEVACAEKNIAKRKGTKHTHLIRGGFNLLSDWDTEIVCVCVGP